ncbi:MAG TPA: RNA polymerase sigma factor, partial [Polyangia bacterium]
MRAESTANLATLLAQAGWLRRFARALVGDATAAEDLAQDTMVSVLRRPSQPAGRAWLATVARNLAVDRFRVGARRARREEETARARDPSAGQVSSPEDLIADAQIHRHVAEAVARLAEPFRQTIVLRFYEGLSSAEIARSLGQPEGTIRWRLKEALDRVRAELDARYADDRSAWRAALAPLLATPSAGAARAPSSGAPLAGGSVTAASGSAAGVGAALI